MIRLLGQVRPALQVGESPPAPANPDTRSDTSSNQLSLPPDTMRARTCRVWDTTTGLLFRTPVERVPVLG